MEAWCQARGSALILRICAIDGVRDHSHHSLQIRASRRRGLRRGAADAPESSDARRPQPPDHASIREVRDFDYTGSLREQRGLLLAAFRHRSLVIRIKRVVRTDSPACPAESLELTHPGSAADSGLGARRTSSTFCSRRRSWRSAARRCSGRANICAANAPLGEALEELNDAIHAEFKYKSGSTENSTPLATIWKNEDRRLPGLRAHRSEHPAHGGPARALRLRLHRDRSAAPARMARSRRMIGAVATHAWIEVLVPGMVWVALDPTNRQWVNERYVAVQFRPRLSRCHAAARHLQRQRRADDESARDHETARSNGSSSSVKNPAYENPHPLPDAICLRGSRSPFRAISSGCFPKRNAHLRVRSLEFQTNLDAAVNYRRDLFDNEIASCFYPENPRCCSASLRHRTRGGGAQCLRLSARCARARFAVRLPAARSARCSAPYLADPAADRAARSGNRRRSRSRRSSCWSS